MRATYEAMHGLGLTPWHRGEVAPELRAVIKDHPPALAVDLGCGTGLQARFLAAQGWSVTAVDFVRAAIARAKASDPGGTVSWRVGDVARAEQVDPAGTLAGKVGLLLDDRCLHGLSDGDRPGWARTVDHLAVPRAELLVRAGARGSSRRLGPAGLDRDELAALLGEAWTWLPSPGPDWFHLVAARPAAPSPPPGAYVPAAT